MKNLIATLISVFVLSIGNGQDLYFPPVVGDSWDTIHPQSLGWCQEKIDSLYDYLEINETKAFILLKDGKIVLEKYFGTFNQSSSWYWASAGKTITSFMTGIAQQEDHLSLSDTTSVYLGQGWTDLTPEQEEKITIWNQLTMTSGLDDGVPDHYCTLDTCLVYLAEPGTRWAYHNGPYTLLDGVIENATGQTLNNYTTQKLKNPTGMTGMFYPVDYNNVYFSNARSMARFGLLMLNQGNWDGNQIMTDQTYFQEMTTTSQQLNKSYGYLWWLNGQQSYMMPGFQYVFPGSITPQAPADLLMALGKNGQFIDVVPSENLVWIRMGEAPTSSDVPVLVHNEIWDHLNDLECEPLSIDIAVPNEFLLFPNPSSDNITIQSANEVQSVVLSDVNGRVIMKTANSKIIDVSKLTNGVYFLEIQTDNNQIFIQKIVKN